MTERLESKLEKLDERVDKLDIILARVDERLIRLQDTLEKHDAKSADALRMAQEAHTRIDNRWLTLAKDLRWFALFITSVGGAVFFFWDKF